MQMDSGCSPTRGTWGSPGTLEVTEEAGEVGGARGAQVWIFVYTVGIYLQQQGGPWVREMPFPKDGASVGKRGQGLTKM